MCGGEGREEEGIDMHVSTHVSQSMYTTYMQYVRYLFFHDSGTTLVLLSERKFELVGKVQLPSPTMVQYLCLHSVVFVQSPSPALQQ